nr:hypothetical protein [Tanacetum cinerariifolium]
MASLADKAILSGDENRPPMLEKDMYDSWRSRMEMYMLNRQHGRIILESVKHGPLLWPSVTEEGVTRLKKYSELPMRVESINGKKYILVIVDDYSRFTWVKFMHNGTEFVNQTLWDYYEEVGISHETSVARSPQQNGVVERRNHTLIEAACTIKLHDLSFFHVFGALCYLTNDSEILGKLQPKADIGIFIGYAPTKKAFRIYNRCTRRIVETIHVDFDELTAMASEQRSSGPVLNEMTPGTISSGLVHTTSPSTSYVPPSRNDWDLVIPLVNADSTGSPSSTTVEQDAPSTTHIGSDPLVGIPIPEINFEQSRIPASPQAIVQTDHPLPHNNSKWMKDHLL